MSDSAGKPKPVPPLLVTVPQEFLDALDEVAAEDFSSRSGVARYAIGKFLRERGKLPTAQTAEVA